MSGGTMRRVGRSLKYGWLRLVDPRRPAELRGERVVFRHLETSGFLAGLRGKRVLEIGPKHGEDSRLLATLDPSELVLVDLPEKKPKVETWLGSVPCTTSFIAGNVLYLSDEERHRLGEFDLVWCLGVLYHNVEQLRLLRILHQLCRPGGKLVLESSTTRNRRLEDLNVVEIHWPHLYRDVSTITHLPSRSAIRSWLEMVGFARVELLDVYSRALSWQRAAFVAERDETTRPYVSYGHSAKNPVYPAGEAS